MDSEYLKRAEAVRRRARKLNWQQMLGKLMQIDANWCKLMQIDHLVPLYALFNTFAWCFIVFQFFSLVFSSLPDDILIVRTLEHNLKEMRAADDETMQGTKGSRLSKWIQSADTKRAQAGVEKPETIESLCFQMLSRHVQSMCKQHKDEWMIIGYELATSLT